MRKHREINSNVDVNGNLDGNIVVGNNNQINISAKNDITSDEHYRSALNWDKKTSLRAFDLSHKNLESIDFTGADLIEANLSYANLRNVNFFNAKMQRVNFTGADTSGALFEGVNFSDSNITIEQLCASNSLKRAILPNGMKYDGRYNLKNELTLITKNYFLTSKILLYLLPNALLISSLIFYVQKHIASYYGISTEEYLKGQKWAKDNGINPYLIQDVIKDFLKSM
ncbi:MAG: pentapeptide repeat-containing protein [Anaerolineales bacterium]|nr:pentapeptide repeat-containing protein [Anaerolineales bacterium]